MIDSRFVDTLVLGLGDRLADAADIVHQTAMWTHGSVDRMIEAGYGKSRATGLRLAADALCRFKVLERDQSGWRPNPLACTPELASTLHGADAGRRMAIRETLPTLAATLPAEPSALGRLLPTAGLRHVLVNRTDDAFLDIAASAQLSITVMAPYLNEEGTKWAVSVLRASPAERKILVIREYPKVKVHIDMVSDDLRAGRVEIFDYHLASNRGWYETFHAKVVLADDTTAYIGSANFLKYWRHSVEIGVVVKGDVARTLHFVVAAILQIAAPIAY
ncbi:phospholipase D-like domain-containing protein [Mesorhizobium sp. M0138]|uniref:phospholipase D-like domain-containing protein n=1 Tax=Mesorhizobium sp. M0138 TaxID=2956891 RepID=UPI0033390908